MSKKEKDSGNVPTNPIETKSVSRIPERKIVSSEHVYFEHMDGSNIEKINKREFLQEHQDKVKHERKKSKKS